MSAAAQAPTGTPAVPSQRARTSRLPAWAVPAAVGALTAIALALRLIGLHESLFGDEVFTYEIVAHHNLGGVLDAVRQTSITPPLHYIVAWAAVQAGDPQVWIRVPSIVVGTLTVPMLYLLGARTVGRPAGVVGAALLAISPFAVWYGDEARTYALVMLLVVCAAYALVRARDADGRAWPWWAGFVAAAVAAMYSHYTSVFVLVAMSAWAVFVFARGRRVAEPLIALGVAIILYLPWIPAYLDQHGNPGLRALEALSRLTFRRAWESPATALFGQPFAPPWNSLLGTAGTVLLGAALLAVVVGAILARTELPAVIRAHAEGGALVLLCAVATPVGLIVYALVASSLYGPRNLSASLPAALLLLGAAVTWIDARARVAATLCLLAAFTIATVNGLAPEHRRPPARSVAAEINRIAGPGTPVLINNPLRSYSVGARDVLAGSVRAYLDHPDAVTSLNPTDPAFAAAVARLQGQPRWIYIAPDIDGFPVFRRGGVDLTRYRIIEHKTYNGISRLSLYVLVPRRQASP